ncbi:MFS transporter [Streptomyces parvulus]|uniref:MFS transporter n=1 Tax=Streptomyces parvulus TaxID=146923 RepID=A0A369UZD4_9ACTN|nr:MFS transporter [Streptomyces parvulus]RDD85138.1 MFS transporter [Streptomyces parvulus]
MATKTIPVQKPTTDERVSWPPVVSLSLGVFALVMAEFLPASLLPRMAEDLGVSEGAAGQSVTVTAVGAGIAGLLLPVALPRVNRRYTMIVLTALAIASNLLVATAPNLTVLLAARLLLGIALGGFWALAIAMAAQLVPSAYLGRAVTVINAGVSVATIAAVPLGSWLGDLWGWRQVFLLGAGAAVLAVIVQVSALPNVASNSVSGLRVLGTMLRSGFLVTGLLAIFLIVSGHFTGFTYIRPAAESMSDIDGGGLAVLLFLYGIGNVLGTGLSGFVADRSLRMTAFLYPTVLGAGQLAMVITGGSVAGLFVTAALWGFGFGGVPTLAQTWAAKAEPTRLEQAGGLIVAVFSLAIASGAVFGGLLLDGVAKSAPLVAGGIATVVGGIALGNVRRRR